jgi:pimeloyl-ACP methyl ester carboxylesterase
VRAFEFILVILVAARLLTGLKWKDRWVDWLVILTTGVLFIHLGLEGFRWQMVPIYMTIGFMTIFAVSHIVTQKSPKKLSFSKFLISIVFLLVATAIPILIPIPKTKEPSGPYGIGTKTVMLVDTSREELYSQVSPSPRKLMVQIWYPTDPEKTGEKSPWIENADIMAPAIAEFLNLPNHSLNYLRYVFSHAYKDTPLSERTDRYPILLFSHGWSGFRSQNTFQVEELVSHGFVVAAPDHIYGAVASVFPDGEVALLNPDALPDKGSLPEQERLNAVRQLGDQWAGDLSFLLDTLLDPVLIDELSMFSGRLDPEKVGIFGHSTGGGAAIEFCVRDQRCEAVLGMDPYMEPVSLEVINEGIDKPLMAMFSEAWNNREDDNQTNFDKLKGNSSDTVFEFTIIGTTHYDFSDLPGLSPLAHAAGLKGSIPGKQVVRLISDYSLAFFTEELLDNKNPLVDDLISKYPEVLWSR